MPIGPGSSPQLQKGKQNKQSCLHAAAAPLRLRDQTGKAGGECSRADSSGSSGRCSGKRALTSLIEASQVFPWASLVAQTVRKKSACNAGSPSLIPGSGRSPGAGHGKPLQYSCLENPKDRGAWRATVHGGHKESDTTERLSFPCLPREVSGHERAPSPAEKLHQIYIRWGWGMGSAGV